MGMSTDRKQKELLENKKYFRQYSKLLKEGVNVTNGTSKQKKFFEENWDLLMENTRRGLFESINYTQNISPIVKTVLGVTKRMLPKLIAPEIVSVQPIKSPQEMVKIKKIYVNGQELPTDTSWGIPSDSMSKPTPVVKNGTIVSGENSVVVDLEKSLQPKQVSLSIDGDVFVDDGRGIIQDKTKGLVQYVDYVQGTVEVVLKSQVQSDTTVTVSQVTKEFEENQGISDISLGFVNIPLKMENRKLKQRWTFEQIEDSVQEFGDMLNFEDEMFEDVSNVIQSEINYEILQDLINGQGFQETWDYKTVDQITFANQEAYYRTLIYQINSVSQKIGEQMKRSEQNFIVVSPTVQSILSDQLTQYSWKQTESTSTRVDQLGYVFQGSLNGKYNIYVTPSIPSNKVLVGYQGSGKYDSSYIYSPYVPLKGHPITHESTPGILFRTRYGKTEQPLYPKMYGVVTINGL